MSSGLILLLIFTVPYLTLNFWRLARGRTWAFTFCQVMKEWDEGERSKPVALTETVSADHLPSGAANRAHVTAARRNA